MTDRHPASIRTLASAFAGGILGSALRLGVDGLLPHGATDFPLGTLLINVIGSLLLGLCVSALWARLPHPLRAGLGAGLLGSFTTFSAVMVSLVAQAASGHWMLAVGYLVASVALGLAAAALGLRLGRRHVARDWVDE